MAIARGAGHSHWQLFPTRVRFVQKSPDLVGLRRMDWQSTKEFLIDNAVLFGSLAAVAALVGFLFAPIRNLLSRKKSPETADLAAIIDRLTDEARQHGPGRRHVRVHCAGRCPASGRDARYQAVGGPWEGGNR